jgi:hypothetical protein
MFGFKHAAKPAKVCSHKKALPRWDRIENTGDMRQVAHWYCPDCDQFVEPPAEAELGDVA